MTQIENNKRIAKNSLFLYFRMFLTMGVGLYTSRIVIETLGVIDYGIYGLVGGIVSAFAFLNSSMASATQRYLSFELGKNNKIAFNNVINQILITYLMLCLFILILSETFGLWFLNNKLVIPYVLLPILTYYLSPEDYVILATFNSLIGVLGIFIGLSVQGSISLNFYKLRKDELAQYVGNVVFILLVSFILALIIFMISQDFLIAKLSISYNWMLIATLMSLASFFEIKNLSLWLVEQIPKYYGSIQINEIAIKFGLSLFYVVILTISREGRALGMFIGG